VEQQEADVYTRFAELKARVVSDVFHDWAITIADDPEVLALIEPLPSVKKQANHVFTAAGFLGSPVVPCSGPPLGWFRTGQKCGQW
jgi:hypothetical protein